MVKIIKRLKDGFYYYRKYLQIKREFEEYQRSVEQRLKRMQKIINRQNKRLARMERKIAELEQRREATEILLKVIESISPDVRRN
ncbi:MAG: hypothetical protein D6778_08575 [Nitrospirae bacterium]|nr:MAG: hypothetical protein D6778_08575 [Nitrospirota bacterium]